MSVRNFIGDLFSLNFTNAWARLKDGARTFKINDLPDQAADLVAKILSDEGKFLWSLAEDAIARYAGGTPIPQIADAEWEAIKLQVPSLAKKDFMNFLGMISRGS